MQKQKKVRTAVIPAAGLGTRCLPATKVVPKELLPVAGKPLIQFAVEEAVASGIERVVLVLGPNKQWVAEHFRRDVQLEDLLISQGNTSVAEALHELSELADIKVAMQDFPLGLANAIASAKPFIEDEPFAVILPDVLIDAAMPCTAQLITCYAVHPGCILATRKVDQCQTRRFGILEIEKDNLFLDAPFRVRALVERPAPDVAPSLYGIFGRYILEPGIFACIETLAPGFGAELQLTDALDRHAEKAPVYAVRFIGEHFDAGSELGLLQASLAYTVKRQEAAVILRDQILALADSFRCVEKSLSSQVG